MADNTRTLAIVGIVLMLALGVYLIFLKPAAPASIVTTTWDGAIDAKWVSSSDSVGRTTGVIVNDTRFNVTSMAAFDNAYATMRIEVDPNVKDITVKTEQGTGDLDFKVTDLKIVDSDPDATAALVQATSVDKINDNSDIRATITYEFTKGVDVDAELTFYNDANTALSPGTLNTVTVDAGQADRDNDQVKLVVIL